jgi:hypothetical protein
MHQQVSNLSAFLKMFLLQMQETIEDNRRMYSDENIRKVAVEELNRRETKHSGVDYVSLFSGKLISKVLFS